MAHLSHAHTPVRYPARAARGRLRSRHRERRGVPALAHLSTAATSSCPFDADEVRPSYRGATLAPWPNRVVDGRYTFGGRRAAGAAHRAGPPARAARPRRRGSTIEAIDKGPSHVTLAATIEPQTGYPWRIVDRDDVLARRRRAHADRDGDATRVRMPRPGAPARTRTSWPATGTSTTGRSTCRPARCSPSRPTA